MDSPFLNCVSIVLMSFGSAALAEGISWLLVYRTDEYQRLKNLIERTQKKVDKQKELGKQGPKGTKDKKLDRAEDSLKTANKDMSMAKMKSNVAVGFILITLLGLMNSMFEGQIVAKLPFEPFSMLTGISHRGLPGTDYTECSMVFLYILCNMGIRSNLQKILGVAPPKGASQNPWAPPQ
eukprot:TRINITY_DN3761_c0_g1_i1.p1 TRINITY_DN3761_c0_g1~~TRINITY_DN3761_c0_g1_i1.p1  ORF type:complete len:199 (+),score=20.46 TRINITY_DN3761_c0_g1_i1:58-597(+)